MLLLVQMLKRLSHDDRVGGTRGSSSTRGTVLSAIFDACVSWLLPVVKILAGVDELNDAILAGVSAVVARQFRSIGGSICCTVVCVS